jgi:hypothetical protein
MQAHFASALGGVALLVATSAPAPAHAIDTALVLPFATDCQPDRRLTEGVVTAAKQLYQVRELGTEQVLAPLQAAAAVAAACPQESGFLLGGYVQKLAQGKRARVWALHGPSGSQQPVVMDVYCDRPGCDLSSQLDKAVWAVANHQTPPKDVQPWSARPTFCPDPSAPLSKRLSAAARSYWPYMATSCLRDCRQNSVKSLI